MTTSSTDALSAFYQETGAVLAATPNIDLTLNRALLDRVQMLSSEPAGVTYEDIDAGGLPAKWCIPTDADQNNVILYFHGGGFVVQSISSHRKLAGHLARAAGCRVLLLDYRQAPQFQYPAQIDDVEATYGWLQEQGFKSHQIAFAGDSAGACLAVTSIVRLRDQGAPLPAAVVGFSPWFDLECNGPTLQSNADKDILVKGHLVQEMAAAYLGASGSATDPLANPLHADLRDFPPTHLTASVDEALYDNAERFAERAREAGIDVELNTVTGEQHVAQFMAGRSEVADRTLAVAGAWVAQRLSVAAPVAG